MNKSPGEVTNQEPGEIVTFRGTRQLIINLLVTGTLLVIFLVIFVAGVHGQSSDDGPMAAISAIVIVLLAAVALRQKWAATLQMDKNELVYRTSVRTLHIPRSRISDIVVEKRLRGALRLWIPSLKLTDGSTIRLADLSTGVRGSVDGPDYYNENTRRMLESVQLWLRAARQP